MQGENEKGCTGAWIMQRRTRTSSSIWPVSEEEAWADGTHPTELLCGGGSLKWPHSAAWSSPPGAPCLKCSRQSLRGTQHPFGSSGVVTLHRSFVVVQSKCIAGCLCYWNTVDCFKWLPLMPVFFLFFPPPSLLPLPRRTKNSDFTWCTSSPLCFARENERMNCSHDGILLSIIVIIFD